MEALTDKKRLALKDYRLAGIMYLIDICALLLLRIVINLLPSTMDELLVDAIFSVSVQVLVMFTLTMLVHMIGGGKSFKQYFREANVRKPKWWHIVIPLCMGVLVLICTIGISYFWQILMILAGYRPSVPSGEGVGTTVGMLLAMLALTAVLPGICEEFMFRGANLTALKNYKGFWFAVVVSALMFGLGHAFILQSYYTFIMGIVCAYLVLKHKNILPAIIIHFMNNGMSVYLDYAQEKGIFGYQIFDFIDTMLWQLVEGNAGPFFFAIFVWAACVAGMVLLVLLMNKLHDKEEKLRLEKAAFEAGDGSSFAPETEEEEEPLLIQKKTVRSFTGTEYTVHSHKKLKINVYESVFIIGAVIIGVAATVISLIAGL